MSNKQKLFLWLLITFAAGFGRYWATDFHSQWQGLLDKGKDQYVSVAEMARELQQRRQDLAVGDGDNFLQTKLRELAFDVSLGDLKITEANPSGGKGYEDNKFTIGFAHDRGYRRSQLSAFLYNVESQLPRMRTVILDVQASDGSSRSPEPGAERPDQWKISKMVLTRRSPKKDK